MAINRMRTGAIDAVKVLDAAKQELYRRQGIAELDNIARSSAVPAVGRSIGMRRVGPSGGEYHYDPGPAYILEISDKARTMFEKWLKDNPLFKLLFFRKR